MTSRTYTKKQRKLWDSVAHDRLQEIHDYYYVLSQLASEPGLGLKLHVKPLFDLLE